MLMKGVDIYLNCYLSTSKIKDFNKHPKNHKQLNYSNVSRWFCYCHSWPILIEDIYNLILTSQNVKALIFNSSTWSQFL